MEKKLAQLFTLLFQPLLMPIYGFLLLLYSDYLAMYNLFGKCFLFGVTGLLSTIIPVLGIFILYKVGVVQSIQTAKREERFYPYLITLISLGLLVYFYLIFKIPLFVSYIAIGLFFSVLIIMLVNLWWKISAHMGGVGGLLGSVLALTYYFQDNAMWLYMILFVVSGIVAFARLKLEAHTPSQLIAGFFVGLVGLGVAPLLVLL